MIFLRNNEDNAISSSLLGDEFEGDSDAVEDEDSIEDESSVDRNVTLSLISGKFDTVTEDEDDADDSDTVATVDVVLAADDILVYNTKSLWVLVTLLVFAM